MTRSAKSIASWRPADLAYCSNVHPGTDLNDLAVHLRGPIRGVRERRGLDRMAAGLWLAAPVAGSLDPATGGVPQYLTDLLAETGIRLQTLNGFPYGDFHQDEVKHAVYRPAWDEPMRLDYTLALARVLTHCLAADTVEGTISTLPLGFAPEWSAKRHVRALDQLCQLAIALAELAQLSGRSIRVCLEPEPDCAIETTSQAIQLFADDLPHAARRNGVPQRLINEHLGLCLDICHQSVQFEEPGDALRSLTAAGVPVGKIQVSSALEVPDPARAGLDQVLEPFAEPRYLHQVRCRYPDGRIVGRRDLPAALADADLRHGESWRIHFHVPIQRPGAPIGGLGTTASAILGLLDTLAMDNSPRPHLEVETYTWLVLPLGGRPTDEQTLVGGLASELCWLERQMGNRGLLHRGLG